MVDPNTVQQVTNPELTAQIAALNLLLGQVSQFLSHLSVGGITAHLLQWMKTRPGLTKAWDGLSDRARVVVGATLAAVGSLGITATFNHDAAQPGVYGIVLSGVTAASIGQHAWSFAQSWVLQQAWFQKVIKEGVTVTALVNAPAAPAKG